MGEIVGGIVAMFLLASLIEWAVTKRIADNPVNGWIGSTIAAYLIGSIIFTLNGGDGFIAYLPGALVVGLGVGFYRYRKAETDPE